MKKTVIIFILSTLSLFSAQIQVASGVDESIESEIVELVNIGNTAIRVGGKFKYQSFFESFSNTLKSIDSSFSLQNGLKEKLTDYILLEYEKIVSLSLLRRNADLIGGYQLWLNDDVAKRPMEMVEIIESYARKLSIDL